MKALYESTESLLECNEFHENYYDYGDLDTPSKTLSEFYQGLDLLESSLPATSRSLLDIGFGNGLFLAAAKKRNWSVHGIDSSASNVLLAKKKFGLVLKQNTLEDFTSDERFDAITLWDVLEHFMDPHRVVQKVFEYLKPGGVVLIAVPQDRNMIELMGSILFRITFGKYKQGLQTWYIREHICFYTLPSLKKLFQPWNFIHAFHSSTDLAKYKFSPINRILASALLYLGKLFHKQNRLIAIFRHP